MAKRQYKLPFDPDYVSIQGYQGSFSHMAVREVFPKARIHENPTFRDAFDALVDPHQYPTMAVIPVVNTTAGAVPYVTSLIRENNVKIVGEVVVKVEMCLVGMSGAQMQEIRQVASHGHALEQCITFFNRNSHFNAVSSPDTALAAKHVAEVGDPSQAAISSPLAAEIYGLDILQRDIQSRKKNKTRFLVLSKQEHDYRNDGQPYITNILFEPGPNAGASLLRVLLAFQTNGIPCVSMEQLTTGDDFGVDGFMLELLANVNEPKFHMAYQECQFYGPSSKVIGCYPRHPSPMRGRVKHI